MSTRTLYALLVGINDYPIEAHRLFGCHNDVLAAKTFLENRTNRSNLNLEVKMLLSADATRVNIVKAFEQHLAQAAEGDIAFFYYSGHGSQEPAGSFFDHLESDGQNETLVCWDSRIEDGMDLADKELSSLIQLVSQKNPHIVTMLDCCHSGTGTRNLDNGLPSDFLVRQSPSYQGTRPLDSYILPRDLSADRSVLSTRGTKSLIIPDGRHVALSAAESFQLAKETTLGGNRRGVFSFSLMEILQNSTADLTYDDIMRRVRGLVSKRTFDQNPTIFAPQPKDIHQRFLDGTIVESPVFFSLSFDREHGWVIDGGSVHGIIKGGFGDSTVLGVFPTTVIGAALEDFSQSIGEVEVTDTSASRSIVRPTGATFLDKTATYRCRVTSLPVPPAKVYLFGEVEGVQHLRRQMERGGPEASYWQETRTLEEADFKLLALRNKYVISRAADGMGDDAIIQRDGIDYRPLVEKVSGYDTSSAAEVLKYLTHITKWEQTLELHNANSRISSNAVRIELYHPDRDERIAPASNGYHFSYNPNDGPNALPGFRIKVINQSGRKLYCSLILLSSLFEVNPFLLAEGGTWLEPSEEAWAMDGEVVMAEVSDSQVAFGRSEVLETLKVIYGSAKFDPALLEMRPLKEPQPANRSMPSGGLIDQTLAGTQTKGIRVRQRNSGSFDEWNAFSLSVRIKRMIE